MTLISRRTALCALGSLPLTSYASGLATPAIASQPTSHVVKARGVKFAPLFLYIDIGDEVQWESMASHNVETIDPMVPEGQEKIFTELGENFFTPFTVEGIVMYKCTPHWGNRMGGAIVVGKPEDPAGIIDSYMAITETDQETLPARGLLKKLKKDMEDNGLV